MQRYINEGRFGEPKTFKTGAVVGSYPKPLLYLSLDAGGLDVLPDKDERLPSTYLPMDSTISDIEWVDVLPKKPTTLITAVDFFSDRIGKITDDYRPAASKGGFVRFIHTLNAITECQEFPWQTVVVDPITGLSDMIGGHLAHIDAEKFKDPRKWTPMVGYQIAKVIAALSLLKAHRVFIFHANKVMSEQGNVTAVRMMIPSQFGRDRVGGLLEQHFYAENEGGKPSLLTAPKGFVKGIGCRWPRGLPREVGPMYNDIYETHYNEKGVKISPPVRGERGTVK